MNPNKSNTSRNRNWNRRNKSSKGSLVSVTLGGRELKVTRKSFGPYTQHHGQIGGVQVNSLSTAILGNTIDVKKGNGQSTDYSLAEFALAAKNVLTELGFEVREPNSIPGITTTA